MQPKTKARQQEGICCICRIPSCVASPVLSASCQASITQVACGFVACGFVACGFAQV
jgi:hypothetical protein